MAYTAEYPRPDFQRPGLNWQSLEGPWSFLYDDDDKGQSEAWHRTGLPAETTRTSTSAPGATPASHKKRTIQVPFAFQTPASGIGERDAHEVLWYERTIDDIRARPATERLLLRFGAVDYEARVFVDGALVGAHRGGHVPFDMDVSDAFAAATARPATARLTVRVRDSPYDLTQPRGKQYWGPEPESIFYTPTSGIWQSVWLESVPALRVADASAGTVLRGDAIETGDLHARVAVLGRAAGGSACTVEVEARLGGVVVATQTAALPRDKDVATLALNLRLSAAQLDRVDATVLRTAPRDNPRAWREGVALWSPDYPTLYDIVLRVRGPDGQVTDEVATYTGMRRLDWTHGDGTWRLNGRPLFQALVLDQGYWPATGLTPPAQAALRADVELAKRMGFNGCRKHQKVEDPLFLYWADRLGYLVWGEMANAYAFDAEYVARFDAEWAACVRRDINHPCVVAWTPVNESWAYTDLKRDVAQRDHIRALYHATKTLDPTRPINDNCGWEHVQTDLTTFHDYADATELATTCATMDAILGSKAEGRAMFVGPIWHPSGRRLLDAGAAVDPRAPVLCTEFGGVNIAPAKGGEREAASKDWGYTTASDAEDLLRRIEKLVMAVVEGGQCCGLVYTQLTDIEQEVNGLYSFDRKEKISAERVKAIMDKAAEVYHSHLAKA
ncbi:hypothetical protein P8C59_003720 [Phyllachora maydis]|uniref:Glycoside hydrolase family 2 protein n=1 Tax=Phyllachora maydis TaxID=1825666 RepID=A0AAD9I1Z9_9PEZI|nr:hypothetical protein P8C59_003720 [Phyllachora maydis]